MKRKFIRKCLISLGLLLFFNFVLPDASPVFDEAYAAEVAKEKSVDYRLNLRSITLVKGKSFTLKAYNTSEDAKVSFKSADTEIASVSEDGTISAKMVGITTITATIKDGLNSDSLTCEVTVGPPAFSVKMTRSRIILGLDKSDSLSVIMKPSNTAENARFSSYDTSIASISTGGRVTARNLGLTYLFAQIDATNNDGSSKYAVCSVIVANPDDVVPLETYFNEQTDLNLIPEGELQIALEKFFNKTTEDTATVTPIATPTTKATSTLTLVEALDQYLNNECNLAERRKARDEAVKAALEKAAAEKAAIEKASSEKAAAIKTEVITEKK